MEAASGTYRGRLNVVDASPRAYMRVAETKRLGVEDGASAVYVSHGLYEK